MKLDIVKVCKQGRKHFNSIRNLDESVVKYGVARLLYADATRSLYSILKTLYREDDWDTLIVDEGQHASDLFIWDRSVYGSFPIIYIQHASHISTGWPGCGAAFLVCREVADMLCATQTWFFSKYHMNLALSHYSQFLQSEVLSEVRDRSRVIYTGIDVDTMRVPRVVGASGSIRLFFPHRMRSDKGVDRLLKFIKALIERDPKLDITLVSRPGYTQVWDEIKSLVTTETIGWLERGAYLELAATCDIIFSNPRHENFGLAVLESVAMGCYPILFNGLSYAELFPSSVLFDSEEEAVEQFLAAIGRQFDNTVVLPYLWKNRQQEWKENLSEVHRSFYAGVKLTKAGERIIDILREQPLAKKDILKRMGWSSLLGWGKYRYMIKQKLPITVGPHPIYGSSEGSRVSQPIMQNALF